MCRLLIQFLRNFCPLINATNLVMAVNGGYRSSTYFTRRRNKFPTWHRHNNTTRNRYENETETRAQKLQYRGPNRRKEKKVVWTYELNKDLYDCYTKAGRSTTGYLARMKQLWDQIHPEFPDVSSKY